MNRCFLTKLIVVLISVCSLLMVGIKAEAKEYDSIVDTTFDFVANAPGEVSLADCEKIFTPPPGGFKFSKFEKYGREHFPYVDVEYLAYEKFPVEKNNMVGVSYGNINFNLRGKAYQSYVMTVVIPKTVHDNPKTGGLALRAYTKYCNFSFTRQNTTPDGVRRQIWNPNCTSSTCNH